MRHPEHGDLLVERTAVDAPRSISFRWVVSGAADRSVSSPDAPVLRTTVTFTLGPVGDGTRLTVVERGFATAPVDAEAKRLAYEGNTEGWAIELDLAASSLADE